MTDIEKYKISYQTFKKLPDMKLLRHSNYYDGPLSGLCLIGGQKYWFDCLEEWRDNNSYPYDQNGEVPDDFEPPWWRRFLVWKLTDEQLAVNESRHKKFQTMVGTHCDYSEDGTRGRFKETESITPETVKQFYEEAKDQLSIDLSPTSDEQILGWYEWI